MNTEKKFVDSVQIGRAFAAMAVALQHTIRDADRYYERYASQNPGFTADPHGWVEVLAAGVDVFFVISGVVMVLSTRNSTSSIGTFLYRRASRIFPLYWVLTLIYIAILVVVPGIFQVSYLDPVHATCSILLVPCIGPGGEAIPFIYAGWTLTYELVFYGLFALSLLASTNTAKLTGCIALVFAWHSLNYSSLAAIPAIMHSSENIILEFIFGVLLGYLWFAYKFPKRAGLPLIVLGLGWLLVSQEPSLLALPRFLNWGAPALFIVGGLMCLDTPRAEQGVFYRVLVFLGAASYSLYLFHFFSLRAFFVGLGKTGQLGWLPPAASVIIGFLFTLLASIAVYKLCEQPLQILSNMALQRWRKNAAKSGISS